jgi:hypothetical protein
MCVKLMDVPAAQCRGMTSVCCCSVIMLSHSVNMTLPWTLGVFMVRDFMGISGDKNASAHLSSSHASDVALPSPQSLDSTTYEYGLNLQDDEKRQKLEHLVGYRAGILSAAFSVSQV